MHSLPMPVRTALVTGNVYLDTTAGDVTDDVSVYPLHQAPKLRGTELADPPALHTDRMVMVFDWR